MHWLAYFSCVFAFLPLRLKEMRVILVNQKYPTKALTLSESDLIHKTFRMVEIKRLNKDNLVDQIVSLQEAWNGGIVFKRPDGLRSFRSFDTLKFKPKVYGDKKDSIIYIIKAGTTYPDTFQIVSERECLGAKQNSNKSSIYVKFSQCNGMDLQLWRAFSEDLVRSYLGLRPISQDRDEDTLKRMLEMVHEKSFNALN